jgi:uncharacterized membrane protein
MAALTEFPMADMLPSVRGIASLSNGHYDPPPADRDGKTWVRTSVIVQAEPEKLYEIWRDIEGAPIWHERIVDVRATGTKTYHWVIRTEPGEKILEWDFEVLADEPGKRIAWRSLSGDPESAGEVIFEPAPGGRGTMVTVLEQFRVGKLGRAWATLAGRGPTQSVIRNLRHCKATAETGEILRTNPQSHSTRGPLAA